MLVSKNSAIVPIGLSCQPTYQLGRLASELSRLCGTSFSYQSSILNWAVCDPDSIANFFDLYSARKINDSDILLDRDLFFYRGYSGDRIELRGCSIWLMHEHPKLGVDFTADDVARIASKYEYLRSKLFSLRTKKTRTFVICNSDNNLMQHHMWAEGRLNINFSSLALNRIYDSISRAFPKGKNRLVVVSNRDRTRQIDWSYPTVIMERENSEWQGEDRQWDRAARRIAKAGFRLPMLPRTWPRPLYKYHDRCQSRTLMQPMFSCILRSDIGKTV